MAKAIVGWVGWCVVAAANAFVIFLFVVFGLAAAAGAPVKDLQWSTAIAVSASHVASLHFMLKGKVVVGMLMLGLWLPLVMSYGFLIARFAKN